MPAPHGTLCIFVTDFISIAIGILSKLCGVETVVLDELVDFTVAVVGGVAYRVRQVLHVGPFADIEVHEVACREHPYDAEH